MASSKIVTVKWHTPPPKSWVGATACCLYDSRAAPDKECLTTILVGVQEEVFHINDVVTRKYTLDSCAGVAPYIRAIIKSTKKSDPNIGVAYFDIPDNAKSLSEQYQDMRKAGKLKSRCTQINIPGVNIMGDVVDDLLKALKIDEDGDGSTPAVPVATTTTPAEAVDPSTLPPYMRDGQVTLRSSGHYLRFVKNRARSPTKA